MNLVFISPNFPTYYWNFCKSLRERGVTVLGVGDAPYDDLVNETKESLVEYYRVNIFKIMMKFIVQWDFLLGNMDELIILNHKMNFGLN